MPINSRELIEAAEIVARQKDMKVTLKCSASAAAYTGLMTLGGGLLAGPFGLALGGIVGGISSAFYTNNQFRSVAEIIRHDLTPAQKKKLVEHLENAFSNFGIYDVIQITNLLMSNEALTFEIFTILKGFLTNELHHQLK